MRVGFFGGTFDPPHRGHEAVACAAAKAFNLGRVLMAPAAVQPLKPNSAQASFADRLQMVRLLCEGSPVIEASDVDAPREDGEPNYTIDTLRRLRRSLPEGDELFVIVGADSFGMLRQWRDPEGLLRAAEWIVVSRPYASASLGAWCDLRLSAAEEARVHRLDGVAEPASATAVRELLHAGESCEALLPASILDYIHRHHLYGT